MYMKKIALAGNPNSGKTTLFNQLTGSNQYVGNRAGVTVEQKSGITENGRFSVTDLPGVYSLSPYSPEEKITRDFLLNESPDGIINIIDGTTLERNLYLTLQLAELGIPMAAAVNMIDEAEKLGIKIDCGKISAQLGIPVVPISARNGMNLQLLLSELEKAVSNGIIPLPLKYQDTAARLIDGIRNELSDGTKSPDFFAEKLVEGDRDFLPKLKLPERNAIKIKSLLNSAKAHDTAVLIAEERYRLIEKIVENSVRKPSRKVRSISEKIDRIATHRIFAFPIFLLVMLAIFSVTFGTVGNFFSNLINELIFSFVSPNVSALLGRFHASPMVYRLVLEAVVGGVGNVMKFLPQIALLFFCLSVLEDSGYMARGAFITDRFLQKLGLSGKSFIPMIIGFGCTTPAVMAARIESSSRKKLTILLLPFMSCGAKITVYAVFAEAFFPEHAGFIVFSLYLLGIICAVFLGLFLKKPIVGESSSEFVMELPPYRIPDWYSVGKTTWERCKGFIIKAGTVIFVMNIAVWILQNFSPRLIPVENSADSIFGQIGTFIAPIFAPLGFGNWESGVSLLSGFAAKEGIVSTLCVLYLSGTFGLTEALKQHFTPLSAYSYMVFCLLYPPCISAFATMKKELGGWKIPLLSLAIQLSVAYFASLFIYQAGSLIGRLI